MTRFGRLCAALSLIAAGTVGGVAGTALPAQAAEGQLGQPQVTINPGGGANPDGSDGLRFTVNAARDGNWTTVNAGQDQVFYNGTFQYCCTGGAPMLNVGGTLYGQAGPAWPAAVASWNSLTIVSTSGSTSTGAMTGATGDGTVRVRYVAVKGGLEYVVDRTVSYVYPNDFVTDSYVFTIPQGNTETVKFYLGGDTAPGSSDQGYGVMLTAPVRSVISLNTSSGIQFGYREVPGSKPFDGATSQRYDTPFPAVQTGGDIGFVVTAANHDAGLMMQWNLGSAPGTQSAALRSFANRQGANLTAGFDREFTVPGTAVMLDLSIENTMLTAAGGLGYTIDLPAGTSIAAGSPDNACGGTLTAPVGGTSVTLDGGSVGATTNCVTSVPIVAPDVGTYTMSSAHVTSTTELSNNVGTSSFVVLLAPELTVTELDTLTVGVPTTQSIAAQGDQPLTYEVTAAALPDGLGLDEETGQITGTPTTAGPYEFTVTAANPGGTDTHTYTGTVQRGTPGLSATATPAAATYGDEVTLEVGSLPASATGTVAFSTGDTPLCEVTLPATGCTTPDDLLPGDYTVRAEYSGDDNWSDRALDVTAFSVSPAGTTVTGSLSATETTFGTPVAVTAEVTPADAGGTVTVSSGGTTLCTIELPDSTCTTPASLAPGTYSIALTYSGEPPRYLGTSGLAGTLVVERAAPGPDPLDPTVGIYGEDIVVTLPGLPADATGTVSFEVEGSELCSYELGDDPESCVIAGGIPAGSHEMTVAYSGDDNYEPADRTVELIIDPAGTAVSVPEELSGGYGAAVTVDVTGIPAAAGGTVSVTWVDETLCSFEVADDDSCTLPADLPAGEYSLLVTYGGDDNHLGSDAVTSLTVAQAETTITVPETIETGRGVAAAVEVGGIPADATGVVTVSGGPLDVECTFDVELAAGCDTTGLTPPGSWPLTVAYSGNGNHLGSTAETTLVVLRDPTAVQAEDVAGVYGRSATLAISGLPADATGDVEVTYERGEDDVVLCTIPSATASSCALPHDVPAGEHELTVSYEGDQNHLGSTARPTLTVEQASTAISTVEDVTAIEGSSASIVVYGLPTDATGTVVVRLDGSVLSRALTPGSTLCSFDVEETNFCLTPETLAAGSHELSVVYSGDDNYLGSDAAARLVVEPKDEDGLIDDDDDGGDDGTGDEDGDEQLPDTGSAGAWAGLLGAGLLAAGAAVVRIRRHGASTA